MLMMVLVAARVGAWQLTCCKDVLVPNNIFVITRHSLVRAKGEVFILLYVCLFVCSVNDFSATRGPIHAIFCMRA